ncbi:zinc finger protein 121-like [Phlebotomus argentipes]|uniref:zinc finger protein 121-like n=1 Tax=Phlebotomus argentipes TaxID=94469 RepID=UPI0028931EF2|nr:zinc finger protein 121-like [Phlebotomus argentipes]
MVSHSTEKKFECAVCSKKYKSKLLILSHLKTHFKKPRSCPHCKKKFENALELQKHIRKEICWQNVAYLCKCGMFCQSRYIPHKHLESHKTYQCNSCDRKFSYEHSLIRHMNLLRTEKAFVCEICQKKFCRKSDLNVHKVSTPTCSITKCPYCAKIFEKQYLFTKHMNNQHSGLPKQPNKSLSCQICKEVFVNIADLMDHVKIHKLEDKRVICTICESIFKSKTNLEKHYKTFHKESRL